MPHPWKYIQGGVGWGFEQLGVVEGAPAYSRRVGTRWFLRFLPIQTCDSVILHSLSTAPFRRIFWFITVDDCDIALKQV